MTFTSAGSTRRIFFFEDKRFVRTQLRAWQNEAFSLYLERVASGDRRMLFEATPGAGKTAAALHIIKHQLKSQHAEKVLIFVPTSHLKNQWASAAQKVGIQLECSLTNQLAPDYHGAVVTYQQLRKGFRWMKALASRSIVVLDEVHHAGEGMSWGDGLVNTLSASRFVLCLSGTAFRSDGNPIPFVRYDDQGRSEADYIYSYSRAVKERVCRPTAFFTYGGEVSWSENGVVSTASFHDPLDWTNSSRRLRAALSLDSEWMQPMLRDAHQMLMATRAEDRDAGGLIVCSDQDHARRMAQVMQKLTGEKPTVVLSDDAGSSKRIRQFSESKSPWLVACNMVSEGVDIPRLRIGVFATTIRTKMYFRQFLGRVVRIRADAPPKQVAYVYLPSDPTLRSYAEEIEESTRHILNLNAKEKEEFVERILEKPEQKWTPLGAINSGVEAIIVHGNQLSLFADSLPTLREAVHQEVEMQRELRLTRSEIKQQLASEIKTLVGLVHRRSKQSHSAIHTILNRTQSVRSQSFCTEEQLVHRKSLLEAMLRQGSRQPSRAASVPAQRGRES